MEMLKKLWNDEEGQGMVEYGLIIALIAIVAIVGLRALGISVGDMFNSVDTELNAPAPVPAG